MDVLIGDADELIPHRMLARALGKTPGALALWRRDGSGPPFLKIGQAVFYRRREVREWLESRVVLSTAQGRLLNAREPGSRSKLATTNGSRGED
jgi:predicted DNA-binding transcriptional regulator AlpA